MSDWNWNSTWPAPAKLNLFLHVVGRRADGYHLLQTVFRFIDRSDRLHFSPRGDGRIVLATPTPGAANQSTTMMLGFPEWIVYAGIAPPLALSAVIALAQALRLMDASDRVDG